MKLIDIKRKLRDLMSDPETEETVQGPVIPPRDKTSQKITSKMKSKPTVNPDMLLKQLEKQTHVPGNHGQLPGSQKSTGKGGVVPRRGIGDTRSELQLPSNVTADEEVLERD
jgi:phenylpropionate dioxygenase-like ring-hydroxylating dioxygenase large terminal subunit